MLNKLDELPHEDPKVPFAKLNDAAKKKRLQQAKDAIYYALIENAFGADPAAAAAVAWADLTPLQRGLFKSFDSYRHSVVEAARLNDE